MGAHAIKPLGTKNVDRSELQTTAVIARGLLLCITIWMFAAGSVFAAGDGSIEQKLSGIPITSTVDGPYVNALQSYSSFTFKNGASSALAYTPDNGSILKKIKNVITLSIDETAFIPDNFIATVKFNIDYGPSATSYTTIYNQELTVDYKKESGAKYNAKNYYSFENAAYVNITVTSAPSATGSFDPRTVLMLLNEMWVTKYYSLNKSVLPVFSASATAVPGSDELNVTWGCAANGATGFELEWTWLEDEMSSTYQVNGNVNTDQLFLNNATRADLAANITQYSIPLYYDGKGSLYYRIRAVNYSPSGSAQGPWVVGQPAAFDGHNDLLNWQVRTSFAEEGKHKTVMEYFDGSLRSRQTVTKDNSTHTTVVAETFYDAEGRPAVQVLPAPGISGVIAYQAGLNLFNSANATTDPATLFDLQPPVVPATAGNPPPLSTASGSSLYYSASNSEKSTGANRYLPDAKGYPYTVTRYTPDASGRIMKQSGVGETTKMGSGKETKYYYGTSAQEELDGLFGTEAGYFPHYFKNMVQDANGQMSVSYVDMHGRTVATALAGEHPASLKDLYPGATYPTLTRNLLNNGSNLLKNNQNIESVNTILVAASTNYAFSYTLSPDKLQVAPPGCSTAVCYDCLYNLEISITDESGETAPILRKFDNLSVASPYDCNSTPFLTAAPTNLALSNLSGGQITFNEVLLAGSYSVRKTLTISEASIQKYKDDYLSRACWKTPDQLTDSVYLELLKVTKCDQPVVPGDAQGASSHVLSTIRASMLSDMVPFSGQYAIDPSQPNTTPQAQGVYNTGAMFAKYNIFSTANTSTFPQPFYKYPRVEDQTPNAAPGSYYDNYGQPDQSLYSDPALLPSLLPADFEGLFKDKWAESLLPYHPEYKKLLYAEKNLAPAYDMISKFSQVNSYADAVAAGYIFTSGADLANKDPFYQIPEVQALHSTYQDKMAGYITSSYKQIADGISVNMWQLARMYVKCKSEANQQAIIDCVTSEPNTLPPFSNMTPQENDQLWQVFRSLYQTERNDQVNQYLELQVPNPDAAALIASGTNYILHFPASNKQMATQLNNQGSDWSWYLATTNGGPATLPAPAPSSSPCQSYIDMWRQSLLQCPQLAALTNKDAIINTITSRMEAVCENGTDAANPDGASTAAPGTSGADLSFEDIIKSVFAEKQIAITNYCNPYVIEFPKPYSKNPKFYTETTGSIDGCNCKQFASFKAAAGSSGSTMAGFNAYLTQQGLDPLTQVLYDALLNNCDKTTQVNCKTTYISYACSEPSPCNTLTSRTLSTNALSPDTTGTGQCSCPTYTCDTTYYPFPLSSPQPMPEFLKCGFTVAKTCYSCAELSSLTQEFKNTFLAPYNAGPFFTGTNISADQIEINQSFARFLNFRTGFQYNWVDYAKKAAAASPACDFANYTSNGSATQNVVCADPKPLTDPTGLLTVEDPCQKTHDMAAGIAAQLYAIRKEAMLAAFEAQYRDKCLSSISGEQFTVTYANKEYHYTLYYYDQAGNLVKTVPPKGVITNYAADYLAAVKTRRDKGDDVLTPYSSSFTDNSNLSPALSSSYCYNSLNQVVQQKTPDAGISAFWYDRLGRLVVSQNAKQNADGKYSYTIYDLQGRITEVGQKPQTVAMTQDISQGLPAASVSLDGWINNSGGTREQLTITSYDLPFTPLSGSIFITQQNLRNRVSYTSVKRLATDADFTSATYYTYDVHGNVDVLLQDYNGIASMKLATGNTATGNTDNRYKKITYDYDLISGKVNQVNYQDGYSDAFYHRYSYDAENRITSVETSHDKIVWERDAAYNYYKHGPLSRTTLGQLNVQGVDYAYTLQGWLKGVNSTTISATGSTGSGPCATGTAYDVLSVANRFDYGQPSLYTAQTEVDFLDGFENVNSDFDVVIDPTATACISASVTPYLAGDMGQDGATGNTDVARDAFGFSLNYYNGDYSPINASVAPFATGLHNLPGAPSDGVVAAQELFNGNIASMMVSIPKLSPTTGGNGTDQMVYGYQYDQLNRMVNMNAYRGTSNADNTFTPIAIDDYKERINYDPNGNIMSYTRNGTKTATRTSVAMDVLNYNYLPNTNKLSSVSDAVDDASSGNMEDIKNQGAGNYSYDAIGNMTGDAASGITNISWTVYGKIASITKSGGTISYTYDAAGTRISKTVGSKTTVYVRDATGNVMTVYEALGTDLPVQTEIHLYGSSRLGIMRPHSETTQPNSMGDAYGTAKITTFTRGEKFFELSNHLGNVLSTISDKRLEISSNGTSLAYYAPDVITATDYAPFGMPLVGRNVNSDTYRYGFNGKENDNEVKGEGNQQDYGMRIYDPRVGRFLSVDPITKKYPELTPYQFASNSPIANIDLDGLEKVIYTITRITEGGTQIKTVSVKTLDKPGPLGPTGAAVILNKDGLKSYMYGQESKDMKDFVSFYEGRNNKVYPSLEGGAPTGGIGHKLNDPKEQKEFPVGTVLSDATIDKWFNKDWRDKSTIVEKNESTKGVLGGQKESLTDFVFNGLKVSNFKKGDDETFFLGFLKGQNGTVKKRIGQTILFRDNKKYNLDFIRDQSNQQKLENLATPKKD